MSTPDFASCANGAAEATLLPVSPYLALQYHFGMLLGVDDFEVSQAYPRGKIRLHNAWLHRDGVVWGFNVAFNERNELLVEPGLALDAGGHELHLDRRACLDLGKWYVAHKEEVDAWIAAQPLPDEGGGEFFAAPPPRPTKFTVHVVAKFRACLTRPVPAIADPCNGTSTDTAFSRAFETVDLFLRLGPAPRRSFGDPYHRLRLLFALIEPRPGDAADQKVVDRRALILAETIEKQPAAYLAAFRELAALDTLDLHPQQPPAQTERAPASLFPQDPSEVVLAEVVGIELVQGPDDAWTVREKVAPDVTVRSTLVATSTIQELLCGPLFAGVQGLAEQPPVDVPLTHVADAGGPRVLPDSVKLDEKKVTFVTDTPLAPKSVDEEAFTVMTFIEDEKWRSIDVKQASLGADQKTVTLTLHKKPDGALVRLIVPGTGKDPVLGANGVPLAGAVGGLPGTKHDGHDFVHMIVKGS